MTSFRNRMIAVTIGVVGALFPPAIASATSIRRLPWEQLIARADFVGVVRCEVAGGIVAKYRVVESFKGPPAGTPLAIRMGVNYWEPQFPITLCGEQYFVTAYKSPPSNVIATSSGGSVPLWWRQIPADYGLPLFQGRRMVSKTELRYPIPLLGVEHKDFASFLKAVETLVTAEPEQQELYVLKSVAAKYLHVRRYEKDEPAKAVLAKYRPQIVAATSVSGFIDLLLQLCREDAEKWQQPVLIVLYDGGPITFEQMKRLPEEERPWNQQGHQILLGSLRESLEEHATDSEPKPAEEAKPPTKKKQKQMRAALVAGKPNEALQNAFILLTDHDPAPVAQFLVTWTSSQHEDWNPSHGYELASYFGWRCAKDRAEHLKTLLQARDPYVRVAGAVYLAMESEQDGLVALQRTAELPGDPGAWAALNLARRGHKSAVPRALQVFREDRPGGMHRVFHGNLQKRLLVLLSNSASRSNLPQPWPPSTIGADQRGPKRHAHLLRWWKEHSDRISLGDPWLETLVKQKID